YDHHQYTNVNYPFAFDPPYLPVQNPCGVYRRAFSLNKVAGQRQYLVTEGIDSCCFVYLNGSFVGYSQVSHSTAEYDVTDVTRDGENRIALVVLKWCDGSYMEDQDKLRMSGVFRDVYLLSRPQNHLRDFFVKTAVAGDSATVTVQAELSGSVEVTGTLLDAQGGIVAKAALSNGTLCFSVPSPTLWNAEHPYLYTLLLETANEAVSKKIGIRTVEAKDCRILVNGSPVRFKGVNRHDSNPVTGYAITPEQAMLDLTVMKLHNINAIRTSHYPNAAWFAELCDRYGFYLIDEADQESHGGSNFFGFHYRDGMGAVTQDPQFYNALQDRVQRCVQRDKNSPAVLIWSLGNESGFGKSLEDAGRWVRAFDDTRLLQYEASIYVSHGYPNDSSMLNVYSRMYSSLEYVEELIAKNEIESKPYILCEYSHAMGNGPGDLEQYFQLMEKHPQFCGGFVWEWCDHAVDSGKTAEGKTKYLYGGDFGEFPHDGNFCVDGLVRPDRTPHRGLKEYKNVNRPLRATYGDGQLHIKNQLDFTNAKELVSGRWELVCDGWTVKSGTLPELDIAPRATKDIPLDAAWQDGNCLCLNLYYTQTADLPLVAAGYELGHEQILLRRQPVALTLAKGRSCPTVTETADKITVAVPGGRVALDKQTGLPVSLLAEGAELLGAPMRWNIWRAPTDNDREIKADWIAAGYNRAFPRVYDCKVAQDSGMVTIAVQASLLAIDQKRLMTMDVNYTIDCDGGVVLDCHCVKGERMPVLPRFGIRAFLPGSYTDAAYFGYGPDESYTDKRAAALLGRWQEAVDAKTEHIRPQEERSHFGCSTLRLSGRGLPDFGVTGETDFCFSALRLTQEELEQKAHDFELVPSDHCVLCIDHRQQGLASGSCGPLPIAPHSFDEAEFSFRWQFKIG
ncbi:MAG: glycoside hydrolase family 2 TIM barrel-domain containing protein, partial [Angelakisella sp.]